MSDSTLEAAIGREIRAFRTQLGLTIVELAKQAGLSAGMLSKVERGQTPPSLTTIEALAHALNVPVTRRLRQLAASLDLEEVTERTLEAVSTIHGVEAATLDAAAPDR